MAQLRQQYGKVQFKNGEVIVVSFEAADGIKKMIASHKLPFTFLLDPKRDVYKTYCMVYRDQGPVVIWKTWLQHIRLRLAGYPKLKKGSDIRQMGGDVLIDREGTIRFIHHSRFPEDRPDIEEMMTVFLK